MDAIIESKLQEINQRLQAAKPAKPTTAERLAEAKNKGEGDGSRGGPVGNKKALADAREKLIDYIQSLIDLICDRLGCETREDEDEAVDLLADVIDELMEAGTIPDYPADDADGATIATWLAAAHTRLGGRVVEVCDAILSDDDWTADTWEDENPDGARGTAGAEGWQDDKTTPEADPAHATGAEIPAAPSGSNFNPIGDDAWVESQEAVRDESALAALNGALAQVEASAASWAEFRAGIDRAEQQGLSALKSHLNALLSTSIPRGLKVGIKTTLAALDKAKGDKDYKTISRALDGLNDMIQDFAHDLEPF